ncbi:MAG: DUF3418 domain-containing protein, partial [Pseudorhodobacter sp.]|nr:DUF3418 domain-containing protein [Frankiaceae bacterium]
AEDFAWQVPGLRHELVVALIKSLPKPLRVKLVPAPDTATALLARLSPREEHLLPALSRECRALRGVVVPVEEWGLDRVPSHLRPTYRVVTDDGAVLGEGKDLSALQVQLAAPVQAAISSVAADLEATGQATWTFGEVPEQVTAGQVVGWPALVDEGSTVGVRVLPSAAEAAASHALGVRRLLLLGAPSPVKAVSGRLSNSAKLALARNPHGSLPALMQDCVACAVDALVGAQPRDEAAFAAVLAAVRAGLVDELAKVLRHVEQVLSVAGEVQAQLVGLTHPAAAGAVRDVRAQLESLVHSGFVAQTGAVRLPDAARYLRGAQLRLEKLPREAERDAGLQRRVAEVEAEWARLPASPGRARLRWTLQELRVSLFAQTLKAKGPVSEQRVFRAIDDLAASR